MKSEEPNNRKLNVVLDALNAANDCEPGECSW